MRLHCSIQSRILSLSLLLYTLGVRVKLKGYDNDTEVCMYVCVSDTLQPYSQTDYSIMLHRTLEGSK